jgi:ATP phosphoribosyltransferase
MNTSTLTLALPSKGAIAEPTLSFLKDCGLRVEKPNQRQYTGMIQSLPDVQVLFQRVTDILYKVSEGTAEVGITGLDVVLEHPQPDVVIIHNKLGFGHCRLVVAVPETWIDASSINDLADIALDFREQKRRNLRIATKYPLLARQFLHMNGIHHFTLVKAEGAIEAAPLLGYADIIIDLTQTGTTLRENNLKVLNDGIIVESQACMIGNKRLLKENTKTLASLRVLLEYIDAAQQGRSYFQLIANIRGRNETEIATKLAGNPATKGLQAPSLAPMPGPNEEATSWYTATLMIPSHSLLDAVNHIRSIGGTQNIVSPVRYVFMENSPTYDRLLSNLK